ncbi:MAG: ATP-grasp domain-containing protein [Deltaproteobacteria bacterium]|nr:ATP-grasp domain-containing protein [Deltaproteobacteria bacterium]
MRILVTCNVQTSTHEDEAEYDPPETINEILRALSSGGHVAEAVNVSQPLARTVGKLAAFRPDLVFNIAEGRRGPYREALVPAVLEDMAIPFTGSDAWTLALTLDKAMTKSALGGLGIAIPGGCVVRSEADWAACRGLKYPVIAKPNFEGSSLGISASSVATSYDRLVEIVRGAKGLLARFPNGLLVEEYIHGIDVAVPFLEGSLGVLTPFAYEYEAIEETPYRLYDYTLKSAAAGSVRIVIPAPIPAGAQERLVAFTREAFRRLKVRDVGRIDVRFGDDGAIYFLEVNALPSLNPEAGLFLAASRSGLDFAGVILSIVDSAARRYGLLSHGRTGKSGGAHAGPLAVGFTYNVKRVKPRALDGNMAITAADDDEAEYDPPATINAIAEAIGALGHRVVHFEAGPELAQALTETPVDVVFNIAEGREGRNREAHIPALLELLGIPYTGSDVGALAVCLDKALAKRVVASHGLATPRFQLVSSTRTKIMKGLSYPVIVKPTFEGSSKGITARSVVTSEAEARRVATELIERYRQPALVEEYVVGREFTVGVLGDRRPRALPPMEIVFLNSEAEFPVYDFAIKQEWDRRVRYDCPANITAREQRALEVAAQGVFEALGLRDVARIDFRMDANGVPYFLEANPLPGLTPGFSDLVLIGRAGGIDYNGLIGDILAGAIRRHRERVSTPNAEVAGIRAARRG